MSQRKPLILLVDDNRHIAFAYKSIVAGCGYNVMSETSPVLALDCVKADPHLFDLVIADYNMPEMRGDILLTEVRKIRPEMPTILITGYSEKINEKQARELGIGSLLVKPILPQVLAKTIQKLLEKEQ